MDTLKKIEEIENKIKALIQLNNNLKEENATLKKQLSLKEKDFDKIIEEKEELLVKLQTVMLAKEMSLSDVERKEVKRQINIFIKEIDDCLKVLES